jgi:hypothetical protein
MSRKVNYGPYAVAMTQAIERAEAMQARAVLSIKEGFAARDESMVKLDGLTYDEFMRLLDSADKTGRREELENELLQMMTGAMQQILTQEQAAQQQGAS